MGVNEWQKMVRFAHRSQVLCPPLYVLCVQLCTKPLTIMLRVLIDTQAGHEDEVTHIFMRHFLFMQTDFDFLFDSQDGWELSTTLSIGLPLIVFHFGGNLRRVPLIEGSKYTIFEP